MDNRYIFKNRCMSCCCTRKYDDILFYYYFFYSARSDRYSHEFMSDEEDGEPDLLEQPFENFSSTAPRMSSYLDENFK